MTEFRVIRSFGVGVRPSTDRAYRVESVELMTEGEAVALMRELNGGEDQ